MSELLEPGVLRRSPTCRCRATTSRPMTSTSPKACSRRSRRGRWRSSGSSHHKVAVFFTVIFLIIVIFVLFAPWTARYPENFRLPPINGKVASSPPSSEAWFGTNSKNFDLYSQIICGGRVSLFIGLMVAIFASLVGTVIGAVAGFRGGKLDDILMRVTDLFLAFPSIVLLLVLRNLFHDVTWLEPIIGGLKSVRFMVVLLVTLTWMVVARIVRGVVLSLREREFIEAAVAPRLVVQADRRPPPAPQLDRPDHRLAHHCGRRGDHRRGDAVVLRLRHRSRDARPAGARCSPTPRAA